MTTIEFRTINGLGNNIEEPELGETGVSLIRLVGETFYEDGLDAPRVTGPTGNLLPNPRTISNTVVDQEGSITNSLSASDWLWQWGQFIDHDLDLSEAGAADGPFAPGPNDPFTIPVPEGDPDFDFPFIPAIRVPAVAGTGAGTEVPREHANQITSFIDASSVYGSEDERTEFLREEGTGFLRVTAANNGEILLPRGAEGVENANAFGLPDEAIFAAGDPRANEQLGLTAVHTLFVREHNRVAQEIIDRLDAGEVELTAAFTDSGLDEADFVFEAARFVVGAEIQNITYNEFLPILIGDALPEYEGYDPDVDPGIAAEFSAAAYRVGHTLLSDTILRTDNDGNVLSETTLGESFFRPDLVQEEGIDTLFSGLSNQSAQELDNMLVDGVRNLLFPAGTGGSDLATVNIARGREFGLPTYNEARELLGLGALSSFDEIPADAETIARLEAAYESVDDIDLWLGAISESGINGGLSGPLLSVILGDQFARSRDGDRFFFEDETQAELLEILAPNFEEYNELDEIIEANSTAEIEGSAFFVNDAEVRDVVVGGAGNDILTGGADLDAVDDTVLVGAGDDEVDLAIAPGAEDNIVLAGSGVDTVFASSDDIIAGGSGDDRFFTGSSGDETGGNRISGGAGADQFFIEGSGDRLLGGAGDDTFAVGEGSGNTFSGGAGADTYIFSEATTEVNTIVDFEEGMDILMLDGIADLAAEGDTISSGGVDFLVLLGVEDAAALLPA